MCTVRIVLVVSIVCVPILQGVILRCIFDTMVEDDIGQAYYSIRNQFRNNSVVRNAPKDLLWLDPELVAIACGIKLTIDGNCLIPKNEIRPKHHETVTVPRGTPLDVVRSSLRRQFCDHRGHASGIEARACNSRLELYNELIPQVVAEKIKKPLKKLGNPRRWFLTAASTYILFCPARTLLI